jgi:hypothetical protein
MPRRGAKPDGTRHNVLKTPGEHRHGCSSPGRTCFLEAAMTLKLRLVAAVGLVLNTCVGVLGDEFENQAAVMFRNLGAIS